ncbi:hypothetical protein ACWDRB_29735 [Nonomuraea sp. NPDC003707]
MNIPPRPGPEWRFCAPPGWPTPPDDWIPTAAWAGPEDDWPEAPPYWIWWTRDPEALAPVDESTASLPSLIMARPSRPLPRRLRAPLIAVGTAVLALIGAIVFINLNNRDEIIPTADSRTTEPAPAGSVVSQPSAPVASTTPASSDAHYQAVAIDDLLELSEPSRGALRDALSQMLRCSKTGAAIAAIEQVTKQRGKQANRAKSLDVSGLAKGVELKDALVQALSASHRADKAYLKWAKRYQSRGCSGKTVGDLDYDTGNSASEEATEAKSTFVGLWNPLAEQEGLPGRTKDEI